MDLLGPPDDTTQAQRYAILLPLPQADTAASMYHLAQSMGKQLHCLGRAPSGDQDSQAPHPGIHATFYQATMSVHPFLTVLVILPRRVVRSISSIEAQQVGIH